MSQKKVAVILAGCGYLDGAEIQEAVFTLLALDQEGAKVSCFAPDQDQAHVVDHLKSEPTEETRNVLAETARITRGDVAPLTSLSPEEFDAVILPGGYGAAKNLCNYAFEGPNLTVLPDLVDKLRQFKNAGKPLGFICISPVIAAAVFGKSSENLRLTIGSDKDTASHLEALGASAVVCETSQTVIDDINKIVTTPAYMLGPSPAPVFSGIQKLVKAVMSLT